MTPGPARPPPQKTEGIPGDSDDRVILSPTYPSVLAKRPPGKTIAYTCLSLIERLGVYIDDGRANMGNSLIENAIRPLALGLELALLRQRRIGLRAAIVYSMIASCKTADVDPRAVSWNTYCSRIPFGRRTACHWMTSCRRHMPPATIRTVEHS